MRSGGSGVPGVPAVPDRRVADVDSAGSRARDSLGQARHVAWIRRLGGFLSAAKAFDDPLSDRKVVDIVNSTHFVTLQTPSTSADSSPRFTG